MVLIDNEMLEGLLQIHFSTNYNINVVPTYDDNLCCISIIYPKKVNNNIINSIINMKFDIDDNNNIKISGIRESIQNLIIYDVEYNVW